jgi:putative polyhydroxyalkanoate system protein
MANDLRHRLEVQYRWEGDDLLFYRTGADGRIHVSDHEVDVSVDLGIMLSPMKAMVQRQIEDYLDRHFG